jgi:hypothetical protein
MSLDGGALYLIVSQTRLVAVAAPAQQLDYAIVARLITGKPTFYKDS